MEQLRSDLEEFLSELTYELYRSTAGLKEEAQLAVIYDRHPALFELEQVLPLEAELASAKGPEEERRLRYLKEHLYLAFLDYRERELREKLLNQEAAALVDVPEGKVPFRQSYIKLRNEPNREAREKISRSQDQVIMGFEPLLLQAEELLGEGAGLLRYTSYLRLVEELSGIDLVELKTKGEQFLRETEEIFRDNLTWFMKHKLGIKLAQARRHDAEFLLRGHEYDDFFPEDGLIPNATRFLSRMGMELEAEGRIRLDMESRPLKSPRAFCATVRVPEEVYLVLAPAGGYRVYEDFLHELGHALHYAYVEPNLPLEFKRLGDYSVTEGYAFLFDHLLLEPVGLSKGFGISPGKDYFRFMHLGELYLLRRYFSKLIYELELHSGSDRKGKADLYQELLTAGTMVEYSPASYLYDVDPHFYCARYIRAWMLEAALHLFLRDHYDEDWFRSEKAGSFLKTLFQDGQRLTCLEVAQKLGSELKPELLKERVCRFLT